MNNKEKLEDLLLLGKEVLLEILKIADLEIKNAKKNDDLAKEKTILLDVIPKYQKIYIEFNNEVADEIEDEIIDKLEEFIYKLIEEHKFNEEYLWENVRKRIEYKENSGAEVVKNLFKYHLKKLLDDKNKLLDIEKKLLVKQRELEKELADCIQHDEELVAFENLKKNSDELDKVEDKFKDLEEKIEELNYKLESKWSYEIYGTITNDEMLEIYKDLIL